MALSAKHIVEQLFADSVENVESKAKKNSAKQSVFVAFSGGIDSTVLLHSLVEQQAKYGYQLTALHVNHNLQQNSEQWQQHCRQQCAEWGVPFKTINLQLVGSSELHAREARYQWFAEQLKRGDWLVTGHHRQDRVETVLFNLMRGAGSAGLSSLRSCRPFYGSFLKRPLLNHSKQEILDYATQHQLHWVEDPSNESLQYSRNQLRKIVLPMLNEFREDAEQNIARAAQNLEAEHSLLREVAIADLVEIRELPKHPLDHSYGLNYQDVQHLSSARQANLVRFWLNMLNFHTPSKRLLDELVAAIQNPPASTAVFQEQGSQFRFYKGYMYAMPDGELSAEFSPINWDDLNQPLALSEHQLQIGATRKLQELYSNKKSQIRLVSRPQLVNPKALQGHSLNLKKWLQDIGVPPWRRQSLPLLTMHQADSDLVLAPVDQNLKSEWISLKTNAA